MATSACDTMQYIRNLAADAMSPYNDSLSQRGYREKFRTVADKEEREATAKIQLIQTLRTSVFGSPTEAETV